MDGITVCESTNMKTRGNRHVQIERSKLRKHYTEITEKEIAANIWDHIYLDPCHETLPCTICLIILFLEELLKRQFIKLLFITCLDKVIYDRYCVLRAILLYYHCAASIDIDWNLLDWRAKNSTTLIYDQYVACIDQEDLI